LFYISRIFGLIALSALLLIPVWAANESVDRLFGAQGAPAGSSSLIQSRVGDDVLARLRIVKAEIRADICSRGEARYCLASLCLPVPAQGCAHK
jgi:hypothetical protein